LYIFSGAPQVYNAPVLKSSATTVVAPPQISQTVGSSISSGPNLIKPASGLGTTVSAGVSSSSSGFGVTGPTAAAISNSSSTSSMLDTDVKPSTSSGLSNSLSEAAAAAAKKLKKKKKKKNKDGEEKKPKKILRSAGGQIWEDTTLLDWDPSKIYKLCQKKLSDYVISTYVWVVCFR